MSRILTIAQKNLKEIFHDYRSLILIIVAPIVVILLLKMAFVTNQNPHVNIGTYNMNGTINREIDKSSKVNLLHYHHLSSAKNGVKERKNDGIIYNSHHQLHIVYANTNSSKTSEMKSLIQFSLISAVKDQSLQANQKLMKQNQGLLKVIARFNPSILAKMSKRSSKFKSSIDSKPKVSYNYGDKHTNFFNSMMPIMISLFIFMFVFLVTGMALLQEKLNGTLSQILVTPTRRSQIVGGYTVSYGTLAILQAIIVTIFAIKAVGVEVVGSMFNILIISVLLSLVAVVIGLFMSTLASSEYQITQLMPVIIVPQVLFSGIIPIHSMGWIGNLIAHIMPVWYSSTAIKKIILYGEPLSDCISQISVIILFFLIFFISTTVSLKRFRRI